MSTAEEIISKLINEYAISGEEAIILLKAIYGRENSDRANLSDVVDQTMVIPTRPSNEIDINKPITVLY